MSYTDTLLKCNVVPVHIMKVCGWSTGNSSTHSKPPHYMEVSGHLPHPQKVPPIPTEVEAPCTPQPVWMFRRTDRYPAPARNQTPDRPAHGLVTVLCYAGCHRLTII